METIFEIFDCLTGKTQALRHTERKAIETCQRIAGSDGFSGLDCLPYSKEGFYVVDMRDFVKAGPFADKDDADKRCMVENQSSDTNSFHVVEHSL